MSITEDTIARRPSSALDDPPTSIEKAEEELSWVGLAIAGTMRAAEVAVIALGVLIFCPPLMILLVVVAVPMIALAALVSVIALPVVVIRHLHRHRAGHAHRYVRRLADRGRSESALAASGARRLVARAQRKLYAKPADHGGR